jgi:hypothetical protein
VPLSQVAADVGLSESGLLHHFRSKKHLLLAVAERRLEQTALWWSSVQADGSDDPHQLFRSMVESTRRLVAEPGLIELFVLVSAEAGDPSTPAHQLYAKWYEQAVRETALSPGARSVRRPDQLQKPLEVRCHVHGLVVQPGQLDAFNDSVGESGPHAVWVSACLTRCPGRRGAGVGGLVEVFEEALEHRRREEPDHLGVVGVEREGVHGARR